MKISDINSAGIKQVAKVIGADTIEYLGDNGKTGDALVTIYALTGSDGSTIRVANTNGDPIWEEVDVSEFAEMLEAEGIEI